MLPLPLPLRLRSVNWWRVGTAGGVAAIVVMALYTRQQAIALAQSKVAYENPRIVRVVQRVKVQGPTRIVTRTIRTPGREEVVSEEVRGPVVETTGVSSVSEPVLPSIRLDRWLAGVGPSWRAGETVEWSVMAGRSWGNRLDLMGGVSQRGRVSGHIVFRF